MGRHRRGDALTSDATFERSDITVCVVLAGTTIAYVLLMPWTLGTDEGYYLYHAVRVVRGEILYRDVSELITPLLIDGMALLFRIFGASMTTARAATAVVQGGIVALVYLTCRTLHVRRVLSGAIALGHPAYATYVWPEASPHWLGTLLVLLLLLVGLDRRRARRPGWLVTQGALLAALVLDHQPTGFVMAIALLVLVFGDALADRRWGPEPGPGLIGRAAILAGTSATIVLLVLGVHLARAGFEPLFKQLVLQPLTGYREVNKTSWGGGFPIVTFRFTVLPLITNLPLVVLPVVLAQTVLAWISGSARPRAETLLVLAVFGIAATASVCYYPDVVHLAYIFPVALLLAAEIIQSLLRAAGTRSGQASVALGSALGVACAARLHRNWVQAHADYPISHETAFGRVDFASQGLADTVDLLRRLLDGTPGREMFVYPTGGGISLMVDARNPTRHDWIFPVYQSDEEQRDVVRALERHRPRYVVFVLPSPGPENNPIVAYIEQTYHLAPDGVLVRNDDATGPGG
jgi:hypothetical protein